MKFGPVPLGEAEGAILAHSVVAGRKIPKGTVVTADHLARMADAGLDLVTVARLEPGDTHEDAAAARLAAALMVGGSGLTAGVATTGRVNLRADEAGIVALDAVAIGAVNRVDPGITVATVPPWRKLGARGLAATIKIIPYAVPETALARACKAGKGAMRLLPPLLRSATLIETRVDEAAPSPKGRRAMRDRLAHFGVELTPRVVVPHEEAAICGALADAPGALLLILTGSATSDMRDTAPAAVRRAGGRVAHYGMPVDPGNLLFLGDVDARPVIGLPGCARSPALNGADWVLERVICGIDVTPDDIAAMGVGGLLKEMPSRPTPRRRADRAAQSG